jgi:hypothetical protein
MGKRIEDLPLDESPIPDERDSAWYQFIAEIDDLTASDDYTWALDTLSGIRETVEKTRRVTEGQRRAVKHIEAARTKEASRRYEGWRRSWR